MLFNSIEFLLFCLVVFPSYFLLPHRHRWILLLAASVFFYGFWKAEYLLLILVSAVTDYFCGLKMAGSDSKAARKPFLILSLVVNLGILFTFKYFNFFLESTSGLWGLAGNTSSWNLILPMGISFYTFQTMAYTIDVYYGRIVPERNFGIFSLYVTFFPQLVAGPIERASHLLPQLRKVHVWSSERFVSGIRLILWGLFKKTVLADRLASIVDPIYGANDTFGGLVMAIATVFFAFQIYCDFSGYSDMAIGLARILGVDLMKNFRSPYFSGSIREFWSRWHISLSTWFRDYLYIPLGGNRSGILRTNLNLLTVFLVSGLWHGANWTFVVWGGLHGSYLVVENLFRSVHLPSSNNLILKWLKIGACFILVTFSWIFFRANNITHAFEVITQLTTISIMELKDLAWLLRQIAVLDTHNFLQPVNIGGVRIPVTLGGFLFVSVLIPAMSMFEFAFESNSFNLQKRLSGNIATVITLSALIILIVVFGMFSGNKFIYFQF
ncbi:MAG: MBOAT family protein [Flavobacteriales bacterium]|nr:MBOAT family protein [Flavobacteriales bacterium]